MQDADSLVREANRLMDQAAWDAARDLYRQAFVQALSEPWVPNLRLSEKYAQIQFWQMLWRKYPRSFIVWENLVIVLLESRKHNAVVSLCTGVIQKNNQFLPEEDSNILRARWFRFKALTNSQEKHQYNIYGTVYEDLERLWEAGMQNGLIRDLVTVSDPAAIPVLELLAEALWLPKSVKRLIQVKIRELQMLGEALEIYDAENLIDQDTEAPQV